ncbi:hypothetical protein [Luteibacter sp. UNCMF366Tsu5.1]|uniref:hypothetical protein n=1 Tax=Luteibacter sp. UNCMF366Tsu5.1 TaxID=1502758 RepID=UPI0009084C53|nr:hypothetical protein [Luteibacter sp. UNCMF366Tsu5.1]SFW70573.1 hypothetical protein SAMN02800691_3126 [Luteibacter sp. UNCMF366Tsu5.1]
MPGISLTARRLGCAAAVVAYATGGTTQASVVMNSTRYVYSFIPLHTMGSERLYRDAQRFDGALVRRLNDAKVSAVAVDVEALVRRDGLAVDVSVSDREGRKRSFILPEREVLAADQPDADAAVSAATHRLVILPSRVIVDRSTGVTHGVLHWRLEPTDTDASPVAVGLIRYTADARGFPAPRMARELVLKLHALGMR